MHFPVGDSFFSKFLHVWQETFIFVVGKVISIMEKSMDENKIFIYQTEDGQTQIDVRLENETVWLTQAQMAELFQTDRTSIVRHINNIYKVEELDRESTCAKITQFQLEGKSVRFVTQLHLVIATLPLPHSFDVSRRTRSRSA